MYLYSYFLKQSLIETSEKYINILYVKTSKLHINNPIFFNIANKPLEAGLACPYFESLFIMKNLDLIYYIFKYTILNIKDLINIKNIINNIIMVFIITIWIHIFIHSNFILFYRFFLIIVIPPFIVFIIWFTIYHDLNTKYYIKRLEFFTSRLIKSIINIISLIFILGIMSKLVGWDLDLFIKVFFTNNVLFTLLDNKSNILYCCEEKGFSDFSTCLGKSGTWNAPTTPEMAEEEMHKPEYRDISERFNKSLAPSSHYQKYPNPEFQAFYGRLWWYGYDTRVGNFILREAAEKGMNPFTLAEDLHNSGYRNNALIKDFTFTEGVVNIDTTKETSDKILGIGIPIKTRSVASNIYEIGTASTNILVLRNREMLIENEKLITVNPFNYNVKYSDIKHLLSKEAQDFFIQHTFVLNRTPKSVNTIDLVSNHKGWKNLNTILRYKADN